MTLRGGLFLLLGHSFDRGDQKVTKLETVDSSDEENDDDDDESIGSVEFPEYVSNVYWVCSMAPYHVL